jgi:hypothetical protein
VSVDLYHDQPHYWLGRLSRTITLAVVDLRDDHPRIAREHLQETIREFLRSPVPSEELKTDLRGDLRRRYLNVRRGGCRVASRVRSL